MDNQIKNQIPKCTGCGREWKPSKLGGVPLVFYHTELVCGDCLIRLQNKMRKFLREWK